MAAVVPQARRKHARAGRKWRKTNARSPRERLVSWSNTRAGLRGKLLSPATFNATGEARRQANGLVQKYLPLPV